MVALRGTKPEIHKINAGGARPIRQVYKRLRQVKREEVEKSVRQMKKERVL